MKRPFSKIHVALLLTGLSGFFVGASPSNAFFTGYGHCSCSWAVYGKGPNDTVVLKGYDCVLDSSWVTAEQCKNIAKNINVRHKLNPDGTVQAGGKVPPYGPAYCSLQYFDWYSCPADLRAELTELDKILNGD